MGIFRRTPADLEPDAPHDPSDPFPPGFFRRQDERDDAVFYGPERLVMHIDDGAAAAVGEVYAEVGVRGQVLDLCSSWVSHLIERPDHLTVLGMNRRELDANPMADARIVADLNRDPTIPLPDASQDAVVCTVSIDYLTRPVEVVTEVARVLRPGGVWCCTFSNRLFPSKAISGWLHADDDQRMAIASAYIRLAGRQPPEDTTGPHGGASAAPPATSAGLFGEITAEQRPTSGRDPLFAVWAHRAG
jgi:SAM-dependent methyltransferase